MLELYLFLRGAWWTLWHPVDAMLVVVFALACFLFPEGALLWLVLAWEWQRRRREELRVVHGPGFTMRDPDPVERRQNIRRRRSGLV